MFKLCAVVSSYYPDLEEIEKNIRSYLSGVDKLIIWENTPKNESKIAEMAEKLNSEKIEIRTTGENEFLAKPFNICIQWAKENGFTHFLTMDQDSRFENGHFEKYLELIKNYDDGSIAVFAPNIDNIAQNVEIKEVEFAITSGAVFPLSIFDAIGGFRENFLIYMIDIEFCLRAKEKGFKTVCITKTHLFHKSGYSNKSKFGFILNNYSAQSTYYKIRNTILMWKLYPSYNHNKIIFYKYHVFYRLVKIIFEKNSLKKTKAIISGVIHGLRGRTGKYEI